MNLVKATTTRSLVMVSKVVDGEPQSSVRVYASPTHMVRVNLSGFRPVTELFTSLQFKFSGGGIPITEGVYVDVLDVPFPCRIDRWALSTNGDALAEIDVRVCDLDDYPAFHTIVGGDPPAIDNVSIAMGGTTRWTANLATGDCVRAVVTANDTAQELTLSLRVVRLSR